MDVATALVIGQVTVYDEYLLKTLILLAENFDYPAILQAVKENETRNT